MLDVVIGLAVFFVLAQLIDGRVAFFIGLGAMLWIEGWRAGWRRPADLVLGPLVGTITAIGVFFLVVGVNGWLAGIVGGATSVLVARRVNSALRVANLQKALRESVERSRGR